MYTSLVLSGGSLKGLAFIGVLRYLEHSGMRPHIRTFIGTSFGAIVALLCSLGLTADDMQHAIADCIALYPQQHLTADQILTSWCSLGLDSGDHLLQSLQAILTRMTGAPDITFIDLAKRFGKHLVVSAANLTKHRTVYFNVDCTPTMSVLTAVRMSVSIPVIFTPVIHEGDVYVDGGLFDNLPINYIEECPHFNRNLKDVLAVSIEGRQGMVWLSPPSDTAADQPAPPPANFLAYALLIVNAMLAKLNERVPQAAKVRHIKIDIDESLFEGYSLETMSFKATPVKMDAWAKRGYAAMAAAFDADATPHSPLTARS